VTIDSTRAATPDLCKTYLPEGRPCNRKQNALPGTGAKEFPIPRFSRLRQQCLLLRVESGQRADKAERVLRAAALYNADCPNLYAARGRGANDPESLLELLLSFNAARRTRHQLPRKIAIIELEWRIDSRQKPFAMLDGKRMQDRSSVFVER
jgi:hypothetical protein